VDADLDTLVTALYVKIDDGLVKDRRPGHPVRLSQAELVCLAVAQALLGFHSAVALSKWGARGIPFRKTRGCWSR
jgi:hypothetical protein